MTSSWSDRSDSCSNRPPIVNDASSVFNTFSSCLGTSFFVAGAVFGEVGG